MRVKEKSDCNPNKPIEVMVVEDNELVCRSLVEILDGVQNIRCVAACESGEKALAVVETAKPKVVIMDINLPGMSGVDCVRRLIALRPELLVVMLTVYDNTDAIFQSLEAGACGYLHKPVRADELVEAVRDVCQGGSPMTSNIARKVVQAFKKTQPDLPVTVTVKMDLTERETKVLEYLAGGYLYKEIAEEMAISWHTVHAHIRHIYEKLHVRSRTEAVAKYLGN